MLEMELPTEFVMTTEFRLESSDQTPRLRLRISHVYASAPNSVTTGENGGRCGRRSTSI
ncbi:hypothetical protein BGW36DRAFT_366701, partial [Talaromyces proteolyticus]